MVQRSQIAVPLPPTLDRPLRQLRIALVGAVLEAHHLADVGGSGQRVGKRPWIDQRDFVAALAQLDRSGDAEYAGAGNQNSVHAGSYVPRSWRDRSTTFRMVSHVRVVTSLPNVLSMSPMNTAPRGLGT